MKKLITLMSLIISSFSCQEKTENGSSKNEILERAYVEIYLSNWIDEDFYDDNFIPELLCITNNDNLKIISSEIHQKTKKLAQELNHIDELTTREIRFRTNENGDTMGITDLIGSKIEIQILKDRIVRLNLPTKISNHNTFLNSKLDEIEAIIDKKTYRGFFEIDPILTLPKDDWYFSDDKNMVNKSWKNEYLRGQNLIETLTYLRIIRSKILRTEHSILYQILKNIKED